MRVSGVEKLEFAIPNLNVKPARFPVRVCGTTSTFFLGER